MRRSLLVAATAALVVALSAPLAQARQQLDAYTARVSSDQLRTLFEGGFNTYSARPVAGGMQVGLVLTRAQRAKLAAEGIATRLTRAQGGLTHRRLAARQAQNGFQVWRSWDEPGGFRDQIYATGRNNPRIAKVVRIGTTIQGREILAVKLTEDARKVKDGKRPAVLYSALQHAREWIAGEVAERVMNHYIARWNARDREIRDLLEETELWFVLVANPDGYQHTFEGERLWRKNMRDVNGDGQITVGDGVDPNRNFPNHFKYDQEGSTNITSSDTYRGTHAVSEPETQAMKGLLDRIGFAFQVNYHSVGEWLLYPEGWQISTATADDPIYFALSGNLDRPAIQGFHPGISSDVLYVTNGETTDYTHTSTGGLAWTPELGDGCPTTDCGFVFPDNEAEVQKEFERNLPFALSVAKSADDPDDPDSVLGIDTKPFYIESDDPYKEGLPGANFTFDYSYGDPQPVQVLAKRSLGRVTLKYRIDGGRTRSAGTRERRSGERYTPAATHYREMRGVVRGGDPGDRVTVWFEGDEGRKDYRSESFTYEVVSDTNRDVLVVAAEDYTGASPGQTGGLKYLDFYLDALEANGERADVYDVDARGRTAPDHLGVLSHYDAVIWYTGDDVVTRRAGWGPGNADRLAYDEILEFREYMNEGGRVLYTGAWAGEQYVGSSAVGQQFYDPKGEGPCRIGSPPTPNPAFDPRRCLGLFGAPSSDGVNDVLEYWFGAYALAPGDGHDPDTGAHFPALGIDDPFSGLSWTFGAGDGAANQNQSASFVSTSGILTRDEFPHFNTWPSSRWDKPGGPFAPHTGTQYVYSQIADVTYKRLTREVAVPAAGGNLTFWTSYDTESHWDHLFVEARTPGGSDWKTLPDANGHTTTETGDSCAAGWRDLHPHLDHYQTWNGVDQCTPTGTTGTWNAASGNSGGWQQWSINLNAYAGTTVEVSIAYVSDWAVQNLGVFLDDVTLPDGTSTSFETGLDGWAPTQPPDSGVNANNWIRTDASGFPVGASITTPDSLLFGFGFEGISTQGERNAVMERVLDHLLD